jgi:hypothetical protein
VSALASSFEKCTVLTTVSERYALQGTAGGFFKTSHAVTSEARASSSSVQGACDGAAEKAEALDRLPAKRAADAGIAVLVGLSGSALGLLRYGFAIASPRNDAIPDDSRDGHLPVYPGEVTAQLPAIAAAKNIAQ